MASASGTDAHSPATCQSNFEQGVALALHLWPDLTLAVQNNWGGPDSEDKRDWFGGAVVELFPDLTKAPPAVQDDAGDSGAEPDVGYVEEFILQVMLDEFEVNVDDDSSFEVADQIVRVRGECLKGKFDEVDALRRRWEGRKSSKVVFKKAEDQDDDTDWDTDEGDDEDDEEGGGEIEMEDAPPLTSTKKEKEAPEVDEEGFTKVSKKKR
ncbi:Pre-rRNA-processing protein TSR2-domain-containing protein [Phialemonium atrogriseum]|uniref:Pre-rRNA-processing protein TSR2-domain-containing protein n=1 Tax=Phialemonium atrogriseum TaxID=1093897 RepID=A0AAJ0C7V2_9PEZI|nr:Pre-rRNA-processing protein TSR2-domain-containing protein [Phialemonium atrogriseum]KAK1771770.1 Pre-rRNA-processing protein TSR2-domain-containing protein [Phialemonium atrogriseum]